jgi:hypothetical protein
MPAGMTVLAWFDWLSLTCMHVSNTVTWETPAIQGRCQGISRAWMNLRECKCQTTCIGDEQILPPTRNVYVSLDPFGCACIVSLVAALTRSSWLSWLNFKVGLP